MTLHDMCIIAPIHWGCDQTGEKCIGMEMALKHEYEILIKRLFFLHLFRKQLKLFLICESCGYIKVTIYIYFKCNGFRDKFLMYSRYIAYIHTMPRRNCISITSIVIHYQTEAPPITSFDYTLILLRMNSSVVS